MQITNEQQLKRTIQALAETGSLIHKEQNYSREFQKKDYLSSLFNHADKLIAMIEAYRCRQ